MATRRRWTEESIHREIAPLVAELGRMPTRRELTDRGLGAAWSAMQRHGGIAAWRVLIAPVAPSVARAAPVPPSPGEIAQRAYFIAQQRGGDPVANWLAAETELLAA